MLLTDNYLIPNNLTDALKALSEAPEGTKVVSGATDLLPWSRQGRAGDIAGDVKVPMVVDISKIEELNGWGTEPDGWLRLGASLKIQDFLEDQVLARHMPHMPECAVWFADDQIRRQATLAGNVVNASPAADTIPPLLTLDAEVECVGLENGGLKHRRIPISVFISGPGKTILNPGEIVSSIYCRSASGYGGSFQKVGHRRSLVISTVCAAALVKPSVKDLFFEDVRLAFGGIAKVPVRAIELEDFLIGRPMNLEIVEEASILTSDYVASRTRIDYRRDVVAGFAKRSILWAASEAGYSLETESPSLETADG